MADTPRTDYAASLVKFATVGEQYAVVSAEFARELERALAAKERELSDLRAKLAQAMAALERIEKDCLEVARTDGVEHGEARTWRSVATTARAARAKGADNG